MSGLGRIVLTVLAGAAIVTVGGPSAHCDAGAQFEYVREVRTISGVVGMALARAAGEPLLVVFDTVTFDPPPGRTEFNVQHPFADDLPKWIAAIREKCVVASHASGTEWSKSAGGDRNVYVAAMTSRHVVGVGEESWETSLAADLHRRWWEDSADFEPADRALSRLLAQVAGGVRVVALVTGDVLPERWIRRPPFDWNRMKIGSDGAVDLGPDTRREAWRSKLPAVGGYWDEESVGSAVVAAKARLLVVAPEARFGDFLPLEDLPQAPWAERPISTYLSPHVHGLSLETEGEHPPGVKLTDEEIRRFEDQLRADGFSEETIREVVEQMRRDKGGATLWGRFASSPPWACANWGQLQKFFNTDVPSSYGYWPFARAAAKSGGAYCFYPFPAVPWADVCPRDPALVQAMAPELVPVPQFATQRASDEALTAMLEAQRIVFDTWLWTDSSTGLDASGGASSWCGFDAGSDAPATRWRPREKPYEKCLPGAIGYKSGKGMAQRYLDAAADYDRALQVLIRAQERLAGGKLSGTCRRSEANLRLCRFWFETSAFRLHALAIFLAEMERFMPAGGNPNEVVITWVPAFKLSDCLDAFDGRTISAEDEKRYGHRRRDGFLDSPPGSQSNFLNVAASDPNFRAKRDLDFVLFNLDPRLLPRALRVIDAARDVMAHEANTAWGWAAYYSDVSTCVWVKTLHGVPPNRHGDPDAPPNPGRTPGSKGGGTTTK